MENMTIEDAKKLMSESSFQKLKELVARPVEIDMSKKVGNDIIMAAFCQAVSTGVIKSESLNTKLVKLLNSDTNTISDTKLDELLKIVHTNQPDIACRIDITDSKMRHIFTYWEYENVRYQSIFRDILRLFKITPQMIRSKMTKTLKPTIVNNIGQLVSKFLNANKEEQDNIRVSITTIHHIVNMTGNIMTAQFINGYNHGFSGVDTFPDDEWVDEHPDLLTREEL